jgi:hypothetical protein
VREFEVVYGEAGPEIGAVSLNRRGEAGVVDSGGR